MDIRPGMEPEPVSRRRVSNQRGFGQRIQQHLILIIRTCGHVGIANTMALADAKVTRETYLPGGQFDKGADGEPNGVIREGSSGMVQKTEKSGICQKGAEGSHCPGRRGNAPLGSDNGAYGRYL